MERTGGSPQTTKAQMEMNAVIEGLKALRERCHVYLFSNNRRLLDGIAHWREVWRRTLFTRVSEHLPHPLPDGDLWEKLDVLADMHQIRVGASSDKSVIQIRSDAKRWLNRKPGSIQVFSASQPSLRDCTVNAGQSCRIVICDRGRPAASENGYLVALK